MPVPTEDLSDVTTAGIATWHDGKARRFEAMLAACPSRRSAEAQRYAALVTFHERAAAQLRTLLP